MSEYVLVFLILGCKYPRKWMQVTKQSTTSNCWTCPLYFIELEIRIRSVSLAHEHSVGVVWQHVFIMCENSTVRKEK